MNSKRLRILGLMLLLGTRGSYAQIVEPPIESVFSLFDGYKGTAFDNAASLKAMSLEDMGFTWSLYCDSSPQVTTDPKCTGDALLLDAINPRHYRVYIGEFGTSPVGGRPSLAEYSYLMAAKASLVKPGAPLMRYFPEDFKPLSEWIFEKKPLRHRMALVVPKSPALTPEGRLPVIEFSIHHWGTLFSIPGLASSALELVRDYGVAVVLTSNLEENFTQFGFASQDDILLASLFVMQQAAANQSQLGVTLREVVRASYLYALVRADLMHQTAIHRFFEPARQCGSVRCNPAGAPLAVAATGGSKEGYAHWMLGVLDDRIAVLLAAGMPFEDFSGLRTFQRDWASWSQNSQKPGCYPWKYPDFPAIYLQVPDQHSNAAAVQIFGEWMDNPGLPGSASIRKMLEPKHQIDLGLLRPGLKVLGAGDTGTLSRFDANDNVTDDPWTPRKIYHDAGFPSPVTETPFWKTYGTNANWRYMRFAGTREARALPAWDLLMPKPTTNIAPGSRAWNRQAVRSLLSLSLPPKIDSVQTVLSGGQLWVYANVSNVTTGSMDAFLDWAVSDTRNWVVPKETGQFPYDYSWQRLQMTRTAPTQFSAGPFPAPTVQAAYFVSLRSQTSLGGVTDWDWDAAPVEVLNPVAAPPQVNCYEPPSLTGTVAVNSTPLGAAIWYSNGTGPLIDSGQVTPFTRSGVAAGTYNIVLRKPGYAEWTQTQTLPPAGAVTFNATLTPYLEGSLMGSTQAVVGPSGGTVGNVQETGAQVSILPGTISSSQTVSVSTIATSAVQDSHAVSLGLSPAGLPMDIHIVGQESGSQFPQLVTITLGYDATQVSNPGLLTVQWWDEPAGTWRPVPQVQVNPSAHTVTARVNHFTIFQVFEIAPKAVADGSLGEVFAFPNPATQGKATIHVEAGKADQVEIRIYDVAGALVHRAELSGPPGIGVNGREAFEYAWDASGAASGIYLYSVRAVKGGQSAATVRKLALVR